ncbi:DUF6639 family protein [Desulfopila sp. IMCC35008]|uniref:DUF6639 family protein n=1 Tax=Desulfopila sp. IMCC35008 TaxID=2653858 RepID=UPI0013D36D82|nr:DUF6639 family protein [Desulfopila sp. IMCC35008]
MRHASVVFLTIAYLFIFASESLAKKCPNQSMVDVLAGDGEIEAMICDASDHALHLLKQYDLLPKRQIFIEVIEQGIDHLGYKAFGSYDIRKDKIQVMSFRSIIENNNNPTMYDEPFDRIHYFGTIVHEITHAVFHHHSTADAPGPAPQEYLAHAIQLSSLPENRRNQVILANNEIAWVSGDAISDIYMALQPGRFAVKSYKHLTSMNDPQSFIKILLNAKWFYVYIP